MRILMAHNFYQHPGGEDQVFAAEAQLLEQRGHKVIRLTRNYSDLEGMSRSGVVGASVWNSETWRDVRQTIRREKVDVVHFHNTFPLVSPAAYYAARAEKVPVVQSLHNFRLLCPGTLFYREGRVCEDCLHRAVPWPGILHSCYRGSALQTGAMAGMLSLHRMLGTWSKAVDLYIALTEFARNKFVVGGLPERKITVKPNFMSADPGMGTGSGGFALFVGRLTLDKGLQVLLDGWSKVHPGIPLKVVGEGPLLESLTQQAGVLPHVEILGPRSREDVLDLMKAARVLVVPSLWYEGFPMTIVEAYACGLPVVASNLGSLSSLVRDGVTGVRFKAGDSGELAACVERVFQNGAELAAMRAGARSAFVESYSPERSYTALMSAYETAQRNRGN